MTRWLLALSLLLSLALAGAQERHNYLAVNGELVDDAGPYYFVSHGDSSNAFAKATPLAEALGLTVRYLENERLLRFESERRTVDFLATADLSVGLTKREASVRVTTLEGARESLASPQALLVNGAAYVAITPLVKALDADADWHPERRLITIDVAQSPAASGYELAGPRTGQQGEFSRVAVDIPLEGEYGVRVGGGAVLLTFPGARADAATTRVNDGFLESVEVRPAAAGTTVLIRAQHGVTPSGSGFLVGELQKENLRTIYVDLAPQLRGAELVGAAEVPDSPPPQAQPQRSEQPVALAGVPEFRQVVVLDAGHGGHDPGASSAYATEKWVVLEVTLKLKALLEREGIEVILTRSDDTFRTLQERSTYSSSDRNIFVSIHANSARSSSASGIETWIFGEPLEPGMLERAIRENGGGAEGQALTEEARLTAASLAADILREAQLNYSLELAETVQRHLVSATGAVDRGVRRNLFYVIRNARIPAILVEIGFVSNEAEGRRLTQDAYQDTLARGLADALLQFLRGEDLTAER